jgi:hypothetical protein
VIEAQAANPFPELIEQKVRDIISHRHILERFSRRMVRHLT